MIIPKISINTNNMPKIYQRNGNIYSTPAFGIAKDEFICTTSQKTSEDDKSFDNFKKWAEKTNFIDNIKEIERNGKILGSGFEGKITEIPDCDNWVIKTYKRAFLVPIHVDKPEILEIKDITPKLNTGQTIARVAIPSGKNYSELYYILKKQTGREMGVPYEYSKDTDEYLANTHLNHLKILSLLPQESYDKLIDDIDYIHSCGYEIDFGNPNNFMYDEDKRQINFVDINDKYKGNGNQYGRLLFGLLDGYYNHTFSKIKAGTAEKEKADNYTDKIINKFFNSMQKRNCKFINDEGFDLVLKSDCFNRILKTNNENQKIDRLKAMGLV